MYHVINYFLGFSFQQMLNGNILAQTNLVCAKRCSYFAFLLKNLPVKAFVLNI